MNGETNANENATLFGGAQLEVNFKDGSTEKVFVRQLPIKDYPEYLRIQDNEPAQAELYCGKESGWADNLTLESHTEIIEKGEVLNLDFFSRWVTRRSKRLQKVAPDFYTAVTKQTMQAAQPSEASSDPSLKPRVVQGSLPKHR